MGPPRVDRTDIMRRVARRAGRLAMVPFGLIYLLAAALIARPGSLRRRRERARPRLVYGPVPITSIKYMSLAMRASGYETLTLVDERYVIHDPDDFDGDTDRYGRTSPWRHLVGRVFGPYAVVGWLLGRYDVFHYFFDGGFLRRTPLRFAEVQLLHLAGKKAICLPYGSDVAVMSRIRSLDWRHGLMRNYPQLARHEEKRVRAIEYFTGQADYIVACLVHLETLPRWDLLTIHYYPMDTDSWASTHGDSGNDGTDGPVSVVHAPNHRAMKGTDALLRACAELRADGLDVELRLLERVPNSEVHAAMARSDIVAEEFLLGYGLTAMEGMSLSKPVLSNVGVEGYYEVFRRQTRFGDCPIVSATPETLSGQLRRLVIDPALRRRLGEEGRRYTVREHSYAAMATLWEAIYARVWHEETVDPADLITPAPEPQAAAAEHAEAVLTGAAKIDHPTDGRSGPLR
jgi:glycosyltransferase involved in cell wall biosynthesis